MLWTRKIIHMEITFSMVNAPAVPEHDEAETIHNMSEENKLYFKAKKEAIFLLLTGIGIRLKSTQLLMHATLLMRRGQPLKDYIQQSIHGIVYLLGFTNLMNELQGTNLPIEHACECSNFFTTSTRMVKIDDVNDICAERIAKSANSLALLAAAQPYSNNYYQAPKPQRSNATSSSTRPSASTIHKGKEIAKLVTPQSESVSEEEHDPETSQRE
ncbi:hypothetical protein Tco_0977878 [Tanacetum coccineum]|uniref:Uncharacterized protein n=1 Tax=Tanacetum coccineum TaxID=301880 RepID=A0ABQ5ELD0_9ASTR